MSSIATTVPRRGAFVLFEGIDRCGKTTQCNMLSEALKSKALDTDFIRFPNRTSTIGQLINSYLESTSDIHDNTIHLLFSANRWEQKEEITKKLNQGTTLVCDRYAYSGVAFSSAKGMDLDWCKACDRGLPSPDCVIYLDMPVADAARRGNFGEERYEKIDFQIKVREQFMALKDEDVGKIPWFTLDASRSREEIHAEIVGIVQHVVESVAGRPVAPLWEEPKGPM